MTVLNSWEEGKQTLEQSIESTDDVKYFFNPDSVLIDNTYYVNDFPLPADYRIALAVDPCRYLAYNCCMNVFGTPEYPALINDGLEAERVVKYTVLGGENAVQINYQAVFEDQSLIPVTELRMADDSAVIDYDCEALDDPYDYCYGKDYAFQRSPFRPNCSDNNVTLDTLAGCISPIGMFDGALKFCCILRCCRWNSAPSMCSGWLFSKCLHKSVQRHR